ncbi:hypothetical protein THASP1DRAFT_28008 [Thamnocephalis sphaerospora]|uniref:Uncharacterized protein n=1 Tax=Thamnocephalis sphaerospora TaxID=78915 RepID=A0A4P9XVD0_9FUNG|nr:hypothetical protein THASP1DRAFT_28008 [Thamnocephalis sphaerospora]|eukprot:RKP10208.1 hypothetical protein THASP1DRAFT_28008 [Thamnocephalis sphaerospora]
MVFTSNFACILQPFASCRSTAASDRDRTFRATPAKRTSPLQLVPTLGGYALDTVPLTAHSQRHQNRVAAMTSSMDSAHERRSGGRVPNIYVPHPSQFSITRASSRLSPTRGSHASVGTNWTPYTSARTPTWTPRGSVMTPGESAATSSWLRRESEASRAGSSVRRDSNQRTVSGAGSGLPSHDTTLSSPEPAVLKPLPEDDTMLHAILAVMQR